MKQLVYRQRLLTRLTHWIWAASLFFLLLSGLQIFNAHPTLYLGNESGFDYDNAILAIYAVEGESGPEGRVDILGKSFQTTGFRRIGSHRRSRLSGISPSVDHSVLSRSGNRTCGSLLLRLGSGGHAHAMVDRQCSEQASEERATAICIGNKEPARRFSQPSKISFPAWENIQSYAETDLLHGIFRPFPDGYNYGAGHVSRHGCRTAADGMARRTPDSPHSSFCSRFPALRIRRHSYRDGACGRSVQRNAIDDFRLVSRRSSEKDEDRHP